MNWVDIFVIFIILVAGVSGARAGITKRIGGIATKIIALILAFVFSSPCADLLYTNFGIEERVNTAVETSINQAVANVSSSGNEYIQALNKGYEKFLDTFSIMRPFVEEIGEDKQVVNSLQNSSINTKDSVIETISDACEQPIKKFLSFLSFIAILIMASVVLTFFIPVLNKVISFIPLASGLNRLLGFVSGALTGVLIALAGVAVFYFIFASEEIGIDMSIVKDCMLLKLLGLT